ncbi:short-chain dehydrogenase [Neobacillus niacini]|uniref:short-chain dehydrogenase n=1 Tax=Neobacillus niacini TaxID=86668 RepID=UPI0021CB17D8|nr:short-chain dehydrogenase [Neobacillus niacini]MCM3766961.1 short-chain dehydrogenase [Neobacillus niacini]
MKHALVIGGTGMLSALPLWLVKEGCHVSVIGRSEERLVHLRSRVQDSTCITPISVDYRQEELLREQIRWTVGQNGPLDLVVAWIHSPFKNVLETMAREVADPQQWSLFHVIGSRANPEEIKTGLSLDGTCSYRQVQLGFMMEGESSRWLTHKEISNGVIEAIKKDKQYHVVGILGPENRIPW